MKLLLLSLPVLALSSPPVPPYCGPQECDLHCPASDCYSTGINCVAPPCCPSFACRDPSKQETTYPAPEECPSDWPEFGSPCSQSGAHCEYGTTECCGETYPEIVFECMDNTWQGYYIDTLCILGLAPPCPDDTTTTTRDPPKQEQETTYPAPEECPSDWPEFGSPQTRTRNNLSSTRRVS